MTESTISPQTSSWRRQLLARLAAERHFFFRQMFGIGADTLCTSAVHENWTAKDLLAHVAAWDAFQAQRMSVVVNGRLHEAEEIDGTNGMAARNARLYEQFKDIPLEQAVAMTLKERGGLLAILERMNDADLRRKIEMPSGWQTSMAEWVKWRHQHDAAHAAHLVKWRKNQPRAIGPKFLLRAMFQVARKEWLTTAALVSPSERDSRPVCGVWSIKDLTGHLTDWEQVGVVALRQMADGQLPEFEQEILDFDVFNNANAAVRRDQPWEQVWQDFQQTRQTFLQLFDALPEETLAQEFMAPWKRPITLYRWAAIWPGHEAEHAVDVRRAMGLRWPKRLSH